MSTYEKLNKASNKEGGVLYVLEGKWVVLQQNINVAQSLFSRVQRGLVTSACIPLPFVDLEISNEPSCLWVENYPYCGLGFKLLWVGQIASCKHVYHGWWAFVHFSKFAKCIDDLCGEEMHEGWWISIGIIKLGTRTTLEPRKHTTVKKIVGGHVQGKYTNSTHFVAIPHGYSYGYVYTCSMLENVCWFQV